MITLERAARIFEHPLYQKEFQALQEVEKERLFCRHTLEHFLDVARIAWILNLEEGLRISKELVYGAALLHDLGRYRQFSEGIPHEEAGVMLAEEILPACGYEEQEIMQICEAIGSHRGSAKFEKTLAGILSRADKFSRNCFSCRASGECYWGEDKKNHRIVV